MLIKKGFIKNADIHCFGNKVFLRRDEFIEMYDIDSMDFVQIRKSCKRFIANNDSVLFIVDDYGQKELYNIANRENEYSFISGIDDVVWFYDGYLVNRFYSENFTNEYLGLYDVTKNGYKWQREIHFSISKIENDILIISDAVNLTAIQLENGIELWTTKISQYKDFGDSYSPNSAKFQRIIGVFNSIIWVTLNSGILLGFSFDTGEKKYEISIPVKNPETIAFSNDYYWIGRYHQLDKTNGKLFGLRGNFYWEIDLANPAGMYEVFDISETCKKNGIRADMPVYEWPVQGNEILFGEIFDSPKNAGLNNVGIFNRDTKQIVWAERIGEEGEFLPVIQKLEMQDNKLYVQDGQNTLYVYERAADN
jgi:hypothetical protein